MPKRLPTECTHYEYRGIATCPLIGTVYANNSIIQITSIGQTDPNTSQNEGSDFSVSLTECLVVRLSQTILESGTFHMRQQFQYKTELFHFIAIGEVMVQSI